MQFRNAYLFLVVAAAACARSFDSLDVAADTAAVTLPVEKNSSLAEAIAPYRFNSTYSARERLVLRTPSEWTSAWNGIIGTVSPRPPLPSVDFATEMVILAAMGTRNSGGHVIDLTGVFESQSILHARVRETSPGSNCFTSGALTTPVAAIVVPAFSGQVRFVEETVVRSC